MRMLRGRLIWAFLCCVILRENFPILLSIATQPVMRSTANTTDKSQLPTDNSETPATPEHPFPELRADLAGGALIPHEGSPELPAFTHSFLLHATYLPPPSAHSLYDLKHLRI